MKSAGGSALFAIDAMGIVTKIDTTISCCTYYVVDLQENLFDFYLAHVTFTVLLKPFASILQIPQTGIALFPSFNLRS